ncbi:2-aminoethylphosphonate--pyruvate transaminase [Folsomia candida]|uniref:Alanine--glyoxylate aminotransferase n=1 Tax=Folsomia candida TaxID=158441 RepID=A0A226DCZ0_FOLCA|nr:2-aminoethylphosphonate--pyruvate transaminase [Folsomia candida]
MQRRFRSLWCKANKLLTANNNFRIVLNPWFHPPILRLVRCLSTDFPVGAPSATPAGGGGGDDGERRSKKLFTPGPLGVSPTVRAALTRDLGSRDGEFIALVKSIREQLVDIAELPAEKYTAVLMQGSGTFAVESVLILASGAYGRRMGEICLKADLPHTVVEFAENEPVQLSEVRRVVQSGVWTCVCVVHCETTSGVVNHIDEIGHAVKSLGPDTFYVVDAMSSFGGVVENYETADFIISSANKCLQGVPGFGFVIADKNKLKQCQGRSASLSLDLFEQWRGLESSGQFRFTPPTHVLLAFAQALRELKQEGGVPARAKRYAENNAIIKRRLKSLGFERFVPEDSDDGHIITSFKYPAHPAFSFDRFYQELSNKGQLIYPGKVTNADCFRIGNIGHLFPTDMEHLGDCIVQVLMDMGVPTPVSSSQL